MVFSQTIPFSIVIKMGSNSLFRGEPYASVFQFHFHSLIILESIVTNPVTVLYFQQRGSGSVPLEQKVVNVCRLNSMTDLH